MSTKVFNRLDFYLHLFVVFLPFLYLPVFLTQMYNGNTRPDAFSGNPILLSGEMIYCATYALHYYLKKKNDTYLFSFIASFFMLSFAVTRAAYLGLAVAAIFSLYGFLTHRRKNR